MMDIKRVVPRDRKEWRKWLEENHISENKVEVVRYKKHTGKPSPSHSELMHEAICFGWIDTTVNRLDDEKYFIRFVKRSDKSKWSENTIRYGAELKKKGLMSEQGLKFYHEGLKKPTHDFGIAKNPDMPLDLKKELNKDKKAKEFFEKLAPSYKRTYYRWIERAKRKETRDRRIAKLIKNSRENNRVF
jgi:uncharacterized protein YdeI (YjbR/CyaY-like superfamily)